MPDIKRGKPSVAPGEQQLPEGTATQLNQVNQAVPDQTPLGKQPVQAPTPVVRTKPQTTPGQLSPDEAALFGPTKRPNEPITTGIGAGRALRPAMLGSWLADLQDAANDPEAPAQVRTLLQLALYHANAPS